MVELIRDGDVARYADFDNRALGGGTTGAPRSTTCRSSTSRPFSAMARKTSAC